MPVVPVRELLAASVVLGAELDTRYRVLAVTVEPLAAPDDGGDHRLQVLFHPVGEFAASLRRATATGTEVLTFELDQLPAVVARFAGTAPTGDPLPAAPPPRTDWGPTPSLQGRSSAPDGTSRHLALHLTEGDATLELHATFDDVEVRDASGATVEPRLPAGGPQAG